MLVNKRSKKMKVTLINEETAIEPGMVLYDRNPVFGFQKVTVERTTKTLIIMTNGVRYARAGYIKTDEWKRPRLHTGK
jgi:hypothetical protein